MNVVISTTEKLMLQYHQGIRKNDQQWKTDRFLITTS